MFPASFDEFIWFDLVSGITIVSIVAINGVPIVTGITVITAITFFPIPLNRIKIKKSI